MRSSLVLPFWIVACATQAMAAQTRLEPVGRTYPPVEKDIHAVFQQQATAVDIEPLVKAYDRYQPANLYPLPKAVVDTTFTVDLTHTLDHEIKDSQGVLLYPQGFTFNPLRQASLSGGLVVIDGSDAEQVKWFKETSYAQNHRAILLLCGGYAGQLQQDLQRPVQYLTRDMAQRLGLKAVPSVVIEQHHTLTVREVRLDAKR